MLNSKPNFTWTFAKRSDPTLTRFVDNRGCDTISEALTKFISGVTTIETCGIFNENINLVGLGRMIYGGNRTLLVCNSTDKRILHNAT